MKLVDDLYNLYKDQLVGDEEDAMIIVSGILEELNREHLMELISDLSKQEVYEMLGRYMVDKLRDKMAAQGIGKHDGGVVLDGEIH